MDDDLDYTFFKADGHTIVVAVDPDGVSFGASLPISDTPCTDRAKLIAMVHDERNRFIMKENS